MDFSKPGIQLDLQPIMAVCGLRCFQCALKRAGIGGLKREFPHPLCKGVQLAGTIFRNITIRAALKHTMIIAHRLTVAHNDQLHMLFIYHTSTFPVSSVTDWI